MKLFLRITVWVIKEYILTFTKKSKTMNLIKTGKMFDPIYRLIQITEIEEYIINQRILVDH